MMKAVNVQIKTKFIKKYDQGYPLIMKEAMVDLSKVREEGSILNLLGNGKKFIGKGYYGLQNKGYGWILTKDKNEQIDEAFFAKKFKLAFQKRQHLMSSKDTTAFRMFNGEGDGVGGLTIDYFDGYYLLTWYSKGIFQFKEDILKALSHVTTYKGVYQKKRFNTQGKYVEDDDFVCGQRGEFPLIVKENNCKFAIYLNDGPMVGVFLDQRDVRKTIRDRYAKGKNVLNTFSYTGAFSVFAAAGGACKTTSVDLANRSLAKTKEQFEINGIDVDSQDIIVEDVFNYFKYAVKKNLKFDMVILDPPSFARSKKRTFSVAKDYVGLLKEAIQITEKNGVIVTSTNCSNFDMTKFKGFIDKSFKELGESYKIEETFSLPIDFRYNKNVKESNYLKVIFVRKTV